LKSLAYANLGVPRLGIENVRSKKEQIGALAPIFGFLFGLEN